jgi:hypothetical protein
MRLKADYAATSYLAAVIFKQPVFDGDPAFIRLPAAGGAMRPGKRH